MMQVESRLLDDLARLASGAAGTLAGVRGEVETQMRERLERVLSRMDLVTREEFETVQDMAVRAREENEALATRLRTLEERLAALEAPAAATLKAAAAKAPAAKKASGKTARAGRKPAKGAATDTPAGDT